MVKIFNTRLVLNQKPCTTQWLPKQVIRLEYKYRSSALLLTKRMGGSKYQKWLQACFAIDTNKSDGIDISALFLPHRGLCPQRNEITVGLFNFLNIRRESAEHDNIIKLFGEKQQL